MAKVPFHQQLMFAMQTFMGLAYLGGGIFLMSSSLTFGVIPTGMFRYVLAVMLMIYGAFRSYRGIVSWQERRKL